MRRSEERWPARPDQERGLASWEEPGWLAPSQFFGSSPWQMMRRMQEDMDRMFGHFFGGSGGLGLTSPAAGQQWAPSVDVSQTEREWCIEADLPGVDKDQIEVQVQQGHLLLRAEMRQEQADEPEGDEQQQREGAQRQYQRRERRYGFFERVLSLPENVDQENIHCDFRNGVLTVHIPKTEQARQQSRRIPVVEGTAQQAMAGTAGRPSPQQAPAGAPQEGARQEQKHEEREMAGTRGGETSSHVPGGKTRPE
jgi:HSP20 family protein